jgi:hypothetical protein
MLRLGKGVVAVNQWSRTLPRFSRDCNELATLPVERSLLRLVANLLTTAKYTYEGRSAYRASACTLGA